MGTFSWILAIAGILGLLVALTSAAPPWENDVSATVEQAVGCDVTSSPFASSGPSDLAPVCRYPYGSTYP